MASIRNCIHVNVELPFVFDKIFLGNFRKIFTIYLFIVIFLFRSLFCDFPHQRDIVTF